MKILLIYPPEFNMIRTNVPSVVDEETGSYPPIGLLYVASYVLENTGHKVDVLDTQAEKLSYDQIEERIRKTSPDVVGIQTLTFTLCDSILTAKRVKKVNPDIRVVLGGPHVFLYPEETLKIPEVDYIVLGEGEKYFADLLECVEKEKSPSGLEGVGFIQNGEPVLQFPRQFVQDLDSLPHPRRELLPVKNYGSILARGSVVTTLISSRGCPFQCIFCDRPHLGKTFRYRSARNVVDEMKKCRDLGINEIIFYDDTMTIKRERVMEICRLLKEEKVDVMWDVRAHINTMDEEMLREMRSAGCIRIHYGIESGNPKIVKTLRKNIDLDHAKDIFQATRKAGIQTLGYFILGNPGETEKEIRDTIDYSLKLDADYVHISVMTPFPGTRLYRMGLEEGILTNDYWREYARNPSPDFVPMVWEENFSAEELYDWVIKAYKAFYKRPGYLIRSLFRIRSFHEFRKKARAGIRLITQ